jgi:hypothetical protein
MAAVRTHCGPRGLVSSKDAQALVCGMIIQLSVPAGIAAVKFFDVKLGSSIVVSFALAVIAVCHHTSFDAPTLQIMGIVVWYLIEHFIRVFVLLFALALLIFDWMDREPNLDIYFNAHEGRGEPGDLKTTVPKLSVYPLFIIGILFLLVLMTSKDVGSRVAAAGFWNPGIMWDLP